MSEVELFAQTFQFSISHRMQEIFLRNWKLWKLSVITITISAALIESLGGLTHRISEAS